MKCCNSSFTHLVIIRMNLSCIQSIAYQHGEQKMFYQQKLRLSILVSFHTAKRGVFIISSDNGNVHKIIVSITEVNSVQHKVT